MHSWGGLNSSVKWQTFSYRESELICKPKGRDIQEPKIKKVENKKMKTCYFNILHNNALKKNNFKNKNKIVKCSIPRQL